MTIKAGKLYSCDQQYWCNEEYENVFNFKRIAAGELFVVLEAEPLFENSDFATLKILTKDGVLCTLVVANDALKEANECNLNLT